MSFTSKKYLKEKRLPLVKSWLLGQAEGSRTGGGGRSKGNSCKIRSWAVFLLKQMWMCHLYFVFCMCASASVCACMHLCMCTHMNTSCVHTYMWCSIVCVYMYVCRFVSAEVLTEVCWRWCVRAVWFPSTAGRRGGSTAGRPCARRSASPPGTG